MIRVPFSFLGDGQYKAVLVRDRAGDDAGVEIERVTHQHSDTLTMELRAGGGFVGRF